MYKNKTTNESLHTSWLEVTVDTIRPRALRDVTSKPNTPTRTLSVSFHTSRRIWTVVNALYSSYQLLRGLEGVVELNCQWRARSAVRVPYTIYRSRPTLRGALCYVIWLFVKRLSKNAIQRRSQHDRQLKSRAEQMLGSATRFGRVSATRQYSVLGRHKPAETEYWQFVLTTIHSPQSISMSLKLNLKLKLTYIEAQGSIY